ncbi:MAG: TerB family tellurite resistance protein [Kordiimonadaceae bacterium]|nr:TerB family tellurite resistance protein [Kordiimonadaceae bacterium]
MWGKISKLLKVAPAAAETKGQELQLATAALLVHVSQVDDDFSESERRALLACLQDEFSLAPEVAQQILVDAEVKENDSTCLYKFTKVITKELDNEGRQDIIRLLWRVAFSDNHLDNFEANVLAKIAGLLGVSTEDRIRIKHEVQGK